jgi:hypothetical protein
MGYMDITIRGSDAASEAQYEVCRAIAASLAAELNEDHSQFNTAGCVNVAMIVDEHLLPGGFKSNGKLKKVVQRAHKMLSALLKEAKESTAWPDKKSQKRHVKTFTRLLGRLEEFVNENDD